MRSNRRMSLIWRWGRMRGSRFYEFAGWDVLVGFAEEHFLLYFRTFGSCMYSGVICRLVFLGKTCSSWYGLLCFRRDAAIELNSYNQEGYYTFTNRMMISYASAFKLILSSPNRRQTNCFTTITSPPSSATPQSFPLSPHISFSRHQIDRTLNRTLRLIQHMWHRHKSIHHRLSIQQFPHLRPRRRPRCTLKRAYRLHRFLNIMEQILCQASHELRITWFFWARMAFRHFCAQFVCRLKYSPMMLLMISTPLLLRSAVPEAPLVHQ